LRIWSAKARDFLPNPKFPLAKAFRARRPDTPSEREISIKGPPTSFLCQLIRAAYKAQVKSLDLVFACRPKIFVFNISSVNPKSIPVLWLAGTHHAKNLQWEYFEKFNSGCLFLSVN
jgi:hypothetical protein